MNNGLLLSVFCLLLVGCGDAEDETTPDGGASLPASVPQVADSATAPEPAEAEPEPATTAETAPANAEVPAGNGPHGEPESADDDTGEQVPPPAEAGAEESVEDEEFERRFADVLALEANARFNEAMRACRELRKDYRTGPKGDRVGRKMTELGRYHRQAADLRYAIRKIGPDSTLLERKVSKEKLEEAGELGLIFLRKAIRDRDDMGVAHEAAQMLIGEELEDCVPFLVEQLAAPPEEPLLGTIVEGIEGNAPKLAPESLIRLLAFRRTEAADEYRDNVTAILSTQTSRPFEEGALAGVYREVAHDRAFEHLHAAELLALVYSRAAGRDRDLFSTFVAAEGAVDVLRQYAQRAQQSSDEHIAEVGKKLARQFADVDFLALRKGLLAWWSFDEVDEKVVADESGNGHLANVISQHDPVFRKGGIGQTLHFQQNDLFVESASTEDGLFRNLHKQSYGFAAWVFPAKLPDDRQPDPYHCLVVKEGWHTGLLIDKNANLVHTHYIATGDSVSAYSKTKAEVGKWMHVVGTVDQEEGEVRLYVNGKLEGQNRFKENAGGWDRFDNKPVRVGAARFGPGDWACRFNGLIDEVAVFNRPLTKHDVEALVRLRTPTLRDNVLRE